LTPELRDSLFAPLRAAKGVLIAVSGGPDSTALLWLATQWARKVKVYLAAATVDHGLRSESALEAAAVARVCEKLGVPHTTLMWEGEKPKSGVPERAREARYALLADHARAIGADMVVTGHHLDDQAETVLMRMLRGSGVTGLAGMTTLSERDGVKIARPLLDVSKAELIACCDGAGLRYFEDPSNRDPKFTRARLRHMLAEEGMDARALARLARRAARADDALKAMTDAAEARLGLIANLSCDIDDLAREPGEIALRLLQGAIAKVGGREARRLGLEKIEALTDGLVQAYRRREPFSANVGGASVTLARSGALEVAIEAPRRWVARSG
jgi:tRNA(Ile)-lysidine synthase